MKGSEIVGLLEYIEKKNKPEQNDTALQDVLNFHRMSKQYQDFLKEQEKLAKTDEKKEEKKGWDAMSFVRKVTILTITVPLASMGYALVVLMVFNVGAMMLGYHK